MAKKIKKVYLLRELLHVEKLTPTSALLLSKLIDLSNLREERKPEDGFICRPTNKYLGEFLVMQGFTIQKYLNELKKNRFIEVSHNVEFNDEDLFSKESFEFYESKEREIKVIYEIMNKNSFEVLRKYLENYSTKEAITFSYLDSLKKIPRYKVKKATLSRAMGVYNFNSIKRRLRNYPNLDHTDKYFIYLKQPTITNSE